MKRFIVLVALLISFAGFAYADPSDPTDQDRANTSQSSAKELCVSGIVYLDMAVALSKKDRDGAENNYAKAAKLFRLAAERGDALAQLNLGFIFHDGTGVKQSYEQSFYWFRKAADQGLDTAQSQLGLMYLYGLGMRQDYVAAAKWYEAAAFQHYAPAQARLGLLYATGSGVSKDLILAHMWLNLAAAAGDEKAMNNRNLVAQTLTPEQLSQAHALAREWVLQHPSKCVIEGTCLPLTIKP